MFSRAALWCFDLAARQIAQESIPEQYRGRVNAQWKSIVGMFDMASFSIAMVYSGMVCMGYNCDYGQRCIWDMCGV